MQLSTFQKGLIIVLLAFIFFGGTIFVNRILYADAFSKEEAQHALYALWLTKDLKSLDWGSFWYDTQRQMFWPFFHSWVLSLFFLLLGASYISARLLSFLIFFAILVLMYIIANRFSEKEGWKIGLLSVFLALSSPLMVRFAAENTLEGLGALIFLAAYYLYLVSETKWLTIYYVFLGILVGLSIYTNYLYAYFMIPAFIVVALGKLGPTLVEVRKLSRRGEKAAYPFLWWAYRKLIFLVVLFLVASAWFFTSTFSRKILLFLQATLRYAGGEGAGGFWQNLLFYPKAIIQNYAFSPWLGALIVISLFMPFIAFKYLQLGKLFTFIWTVIVLATLTIPSRAPQFIYIIAPFLFLVFASAVFYLKDRLKQYGGVFLFIIFVPLLVSLPNLSRVYFPARPAENMAGVLNYFHGEVLPRYPVAAAVNLQHLNPETIAFHFWGWNAPVLADPVMGEDEMFSNARYFITVELDPGSPYASENLDDSIYRWNAFLSLKRGLGEVREYSQRRFSDIGLTAKIYEKTAR